MFFFDIFPTFREAPYSYLLVPIILTCSMIGFCNKRFFHRHLLHPYEIWRGKRFHTLLTSALIHRNWLHLLNNLLVIYGLGYDMSGILKQEYGELTSYVMTPMLFISLIIFPNLIQTVLKKDDFVFTALGASGLSFGLYGFSALFFPIQKMSNFIFPFIDNMLQNWLLGAIILLLLAATKKNSLINVRLHFSAYVIGGLLALCLRPRSILEIVHWLTN